jgi:hypothetical protein
MLLGLRPCANLNMASEAKGWEAVQPLFKILYTPVEIQMERDSDTASPLKVAGGWISPMVL